MPQLTGCSHPVMWQHHYLHLLKIIVCLNEFAIQPVAEGIEILLVLDCLQSIYWSDDEELYDQLTVGVNRLENDVIT